jgi:hypothetical protein
MSGGGTGGASAGEGSELGRAACFGAQLGSGGDVLVSDNGARLGSDGDALASDNDAQLGSGGGAVCIYGGGFISLPSAVVDRDTPLPGTEAGGAPTPLPDAAAGGAPTSLPGAAVGLLEPEVWMEVVLM